MAKQDATHTDSTIFGVLAKCNKKWMRVWSTLDASQWRTQRKVKTMPQTPSCKRPIAFREQCESVLGREVTQTFVYGAKPFECRHQKSEWVISVRLITPLQNSPSSYQ